MNSYAALIASFLVLFTTPMSAEQPSPSQDMDQNQSMEITSFPDLRNHLDLQVSWYTTESAWIGFHFGRGVVLDRSTKQFQGADRVLVGGNIDTYFQHTPGYVYPYQKRDFQVSIGSFLKDWPLYGTLFAGILGREKEIYVKTIDVDRLLFFQMPLPPLPPLTYQREQSRRFYAGPSIGIKGAVLSNTVLGIEMGTAYSAPLRQKIAVRGNFGGLLPGARQIDPVTVGLEQWRERYSFPKAPRAGIFWRVFAGLRVDLGPTRHVENPGPGSKDKAKEKNRSDKIEP